MKFTLINRINRPLNSGVQPIAFALTAFLFVGFFAATMNAASSGALDLSFGDRGIVSFLDSPGVFFQAIQDTVVQADGKIIVVGKAMPCNNSSCTNDIFVARLNPDGTYDTSFGTNGKVLYDNSNQTEGAYAVKIQTDGRIVVAAGLVAGNTGTYVRGFKVLRFMPNGSLDSSFGTNGFVYESFNDTGFPSEIFIQSDGKILVVGDNLQNANSRDMLFFARFNVDGSLDNSFGTNGTFTKSLTFRNVKITQQSNKKLIVATGVFPNTLELRRYNADGSLDNNFGNSGVANFPSFNGNLAAVAVQPDDKIIASGFRDDYIYPPLMRVNADGTQDTGFIANHGQLIPLDTRSYCFNCTENVSEIVLLPDGRFYLSGSSANRSPFFWTSISLYSSNGKINPSFGFRGESTLRVLSTTNVAKTNLSVKSDGKLLVVPTSNQGKLAQLNSTATPPSQRGDFDGDLKTDVAVFRPSNGYWYLQKSSDNSFFAHPFGADSDVILPGDYDYDRRTDFAIYRPGNNLWYIQPFVSNGYSPIGNGAFGTTGDIRLPQDFDGDGFTDIAYFRPSNGTWYFRYSTFPGSEINESIHFGQNGDIPIPADYDGDGRADIAVFRPSNGAWYILRSSDGSFSGVQFGFGTDKLVPGDYDGDGRADIAVVRDGNWYILRSADNSFYGITWGFGTDKPVPGDYDGDGKFDFAVYRPSNGAWYILNSADSSFQAYIFGASEDIPIPFVFTKN